MKKVHIYINNQKLGVEKNFHQYKDKLFFRTISKNSRESSGKNASIENQKKVKEMLRHEAIHQWIRQSAN